MARGARRKGAGRGEKSAASDKAEEDPEQADAEGAEDRPAKRRKEKAEDAAHEEVPSDRGEVEDDEEEEEESDEEIVEGGEEQDEEEESEDGEGAPGRIWRPGVDEILEGEQLDYDPASYDMIHRAQVEWPCLSIDIVRDDLGAQRTSFPMTAYVVAGTQADQTFDNRIYMMKWSRLYRTAKDGCDDSDENDSDFDSDEEHEAQLVAKGVSHPGSVNRVRAMPQACHIVSTWADTGKVYMWNLDLQRKALDKASDKVPTTSKPIHTCEAHKGEGFAMDFSPHETGRFLSGGNDGQVLLWEPVPGGWNVAADSPFSAHTAAVEDVQWKRTGGSTTTFATCSVDQSLRVWDVRETNRKKSALHVEKAHESDINVLGWNPVMGELIVTGADDGRFKVWDIRNVSAGPMANFLFHRKPITSVDWHPTDETMLAVSSEDNTVSIWDMAVEDDNEGRELPPGAEHYPPQLMFLHQGLRDPKELRWHPQLPGVVVCTAGSGFNIFKTCNV